MSKADCINTTPAPEALELFREIAARSGDTLILGDGPPHPDAQLLQLVVDVLDLNKRETIKLDEVHATWSQSKHPFGEQALKEQKDGRAECARMRTEIKRLTLRASKIRAATPAGLFAKTQMLRVTLTTQRGLAGSIAADILENAAIRAALWPTRQDGGHPS